MLWVQCFCVSVLFAVWALPETILVRNFCLVLGALIGSYQIIYYRALFFQKTAIPSWFILGLFVWATFHLIYFANDFNLQLYEYTSIWKRVVIGSIFAIGMGVAIRNNYWGSEKYFFSYLLFFGILTPTLIYIMKYFLSNYGLNAGWRIPEYLRLYSGSDRYYLPKTAYVSFCLPALAYALGGIYQNILKQQLKSIRTLIYLISVPLVIYVFYSEKIKNGIIYSSLLITVFSLATLLVHIKLNWRWKIISVVFIITIIQLMSSLYMQSNSDLKTFIVDAKVALKTDEYMSWRYDGDMGYPYNELGSTVSATTYMRVAWAREATFLIAESPFGYGLVERSFGHLGKIKWPDSKLHQSHSGWLDLALGIGLPGIALILLPMVILIMSNVFQCDSGNDVEKECQINLPIKYVLLGLILAWCTTELSQKVFFDELVFWISLASGLSISGMDARTSHAINKQITD